MTRTIKNSQVNNLILKRVEQSTFNLLAAKLRLVEFTYGEHIHREHKKVRTVHFINSGMVSLLKRMEDGRTVEVGVRGIEAVTSPSALFGVNAAFDSVIQVPCIAFAIDVQELRSAMERDTGLKDLLLRYFHLAINQMAQTAACNRLHTIPQRCARWLLHCNDNALSERFQITQDHLAMLLGVNRPGVSQAMTDLREQGFVTYQRGDVTLLDRPGLEGRACECYRTLRDETDMLLA